MGDVKYVESDRYDAAYEFWGCPEKCGGYWDYESALLHYSDYLDWPR